MNAVARMVSRYGRLLDARGDESGAEARRLRLLPAVQFRYQRELEPPDASEGFSRIEVAAVRAAAATALDQSRGDRLV